MTPEENEARAKAFGGGPVVTDVDAKGTRKPISRLPPVDIEDEISMLIHGRGGPVMKDVAQRDPIPRMGPRTIGTNAVQEAAKLGAIKDDHDKMGFEFLPPDALSEINKVLRFGAVKYAPYNWEKGFTWLRLVNAAMRHLFAYATGEDKDPETGLSHLAHAGCMILFALSHEIRGIGEDDRPKR